MARLVISIMLASAVADDQRLRGAQTAGSFSVAHRSGGRHASFAITPQYDDAPLITCEGNEGKCISPEGTVVEDYGEMECNTVSAPFLVADPENNGLEKDALALQAHFREKRDYMVRELEAMGIKARVPKSTFYIWADVSVAYCVCSMAWGPTRVSPHRRCRRR